MTMLIPGTAAGWPLGPYVTLQGPVEVAAGVAATYKGVYEAVWLAGVPASDIEVEVDAQVAVTARTGSYGTWNAELAFPERGAYAVQAIAERGGHLEARSPTLTVRAGVPPGPPSVTLARGEYFDEVVVTWDAPADDGGTSVRSTLIERAGPGAEWTLIADVAGDSGRVVDVVDDVGRTHEYRARSVTVAGPGAPATAAIAVDPAPAADAVGSRITSVLGCYEKGGSRMCERETVRFADLFVVRNARATFWVDYTARVTLEGEGVEGGRVRTELIADWQPECNGICSDEWTRFGHTVRDVRVDADGGVREIDVGGWSTTTPERESCHRYRFRATTEYYGELVARDQWQFTICGL